LQSRHFLNANPGLILKPPSWWAASVSASQTSTDPRSGLLNPGMTIPL
jgi:hypothetical protein